MRRTLRAILGEKGMKVIIYHLERRCIFALDDALRPEELADALEQIFGTGARIIEEHILKNLHQDLGLLYNGSNDADSLDFAKRLREALKRTRI